MPKKRRALARTSVIPTAAIEGRIHMIRGLRIMLDRDLAEMYGVETKVLNQAVARNASRFPADFAFALSRAELENLKSQTVTSSSWGGRRKPSRAFTERRPTSTTRSTSSASTTWPRPFPSRTPTSHRLRPRSQRTLTAFPRRLPTFHRTV